MARTIGKAAAELGINVETIRFYQRERLVPVPPKPPRGYRVYDEDLMNQLRFIKRAQRLGFTLDEVRQLMRLSDDSRNGARDAKRVTAQKLAEVRTKIEDLQRMESALQTLIEECPGHGPSCGCPILAALNGDNEPL